MSAQTDFDTEGRFAILRRSYGAALREKIERLERAAKDCALDKEEHTRTCLEEARAISHKIAGSAATFGFGQAGIVARTLEQHLAKTIADQAPPCEKDLEEFRNLLRALSFEEAQSSSVTARNGANESSLTEPNHHAICSSAPKRHHRLLIAHGGYFPGRDFLLAFESHGFEVHVSEEFETAVSQAEEFRPDAVIIVLDQGEITGFELAEKLWGRVASHGVEIFFFVRSQEFRRRVLLNGISDEWIICAPFDNEQLASGVLRRTFDVKAGRAQNNRPYMMPYLGMFKKLAIPSNDPCVAISLVNPSKKKVLIIDDDRHLVEAISNVLGEKAIEVLKAYSGFQGLKLALKERPDLIITDFEMPNGTAEYLFAELGKSDTVRPAVIVMTAATVVEKYHLSKNSAFRVNVLAHFAKPLDLARLGMEVEQHLEAMSGR